MHRTPADHPRYPWRFSLGDNIYLLRRTQDTTFEVIGGELHLRCPHLHVRDVLGATWRVPQLHASSKPISV